MVTCEDIDLDINIIGLARPQNTSPCHGKFYLKEDEIFVRQESPIYRYYVLCPHCGYMVRILGNMLPKASIERIEKRSVEDPDLFRKMYLYSELFSMTLRYLIFLAICGAIFNILESSIFLESPTPNSSKNGISSLVTKQAVTTIGPK